jgi:hypothetical protein
MRKGREYVCMREGGRLKHLTLVGLAIATNLLRIVSARLCSLRYEALRIGITEKRGNIGVATEER